ncbi:toll-like receptor 2 type-1 [Patella vulgata]|uniref:toll-like receptor 2 type-1 n=1 Tax=Patella vulgata TaxID=6465 RepID=UPI00218005FB|nr:toll-like receptor 2 type-1 [Patella vulgata]
MELTSVFVCCILVIVICHGSKEKRPCVKDSSSKTICWCLGNGYTDCSGHGLNYIPVLPNTTTRLKLRNNNLKILNVQMLKNISNNQLTDLDVSKNKIEKIDSDFIGFFKRLQILNLNVNPLTNEPLKASLKNISTSLQKLFIGGLNLSHFDDDLLKPLNGSMLTTLGLSNNSFHVFNGGHIFNYLKHLTSLYLSYNYINNFNASHSYSLKQLSLTRNDLTEVPPFCSRAEALFPNLEELYIDQNCISVLNMNNLNCLDNLIKLNISETRIETLKSYTFSKLKRLIALSAHYMEGFNYIEPYAFNSSSLQRINIRDNNLQFKVSKMNISLVFSGCPNLKVLDISNNFLGKLRNAEWDVLFAKFSKLTYLDISRGYLLYLPNAIPDVLHNLKELRVSDNGIDIIPPGYFNTLYNITDIYLNGNKLTTLNHTQLPTTKLHHLNLAYNPFVCDCNILWLIDYLRHHKRIVSYYPDHYICTDNKLRLEDLKINTGSCLIGEQTSTIIKCFCFSVMLILLIISGVYRYRWRLRYVMYILNYKRRKYMNGSMKSSNFSHDVYISCGEADFNFVYSNIVETLEEDNFNVYISERDAVGGSLKITSTLDNMDGSRFVLLCLSNSYVQDHWCEYETYMAIERSIYEGHDVLIVVLLEDISSVNMNKTIHKLVKNYNFILWGTNDEAQGLSLRKLVRVIGNENM